MRSLAGRRLLRAPRAAAGRGAASAAAAASRGQRGQRAPGGGRAGKAGSGAAPLWEEPVAEDASFKDLPLSDPLRLRLRSLGARVPTKLQRLVLRPALEGRDVLAVARAGSGKTLAFLLPLLERASRERWPGSEPAVVLEPTRDLAEQTYAAASRLRDPYTKVALLYGGAGPQSLEAQRALLLRGAQLVVGTPGRVWELARSGDLAPERLRALVVDEAEEMLAAGLQKDVRALLCDPARAKTRQTLLFAGAMPPRLQEELAGLLRRPLLVDLSKGQPLLPQEVRHLSCQAPSSLLRRARVIAWLLEGRLTKGGRAIIFAPTRAEVAFLSTHAMLQHRTVALHGEMSQKDRSLALELYAAGSGRYALVTTDLAVRGLEVPSASLVVHAAPPESWEAYVHRASRAGGRGGSKPSAAAPESVVLCRDRMVNQLRELERELGKKFEPMEPPDEDSLRKTAVAFISQELKEAVTQYDVQAFEEDARRQVELRGEAIMAAALVLLERRRRGQEWVSPLSGRARYTPLLFLDPFLERIKSRRDVLAAVARALRNRAAEADASAGEAPASRRLRRRRGSEEGGGGRLFYAHRVGRVELTSQGYVADVPHEDVPALLGDEALREQGVSVMPVTQLPQVIEESRRGGSRAPRRPRPHARPRRSLGAARRKRRLEFLFPQGRREPFGPWLPGGRKDPGQGQKETSK